MTKRWGRNGWFLGCSRYPDCKHTRPVPLEFEYREALLQVIDSKIAGQPVAAPEPEPESSKLTDLMAVLEASVAAARSEQPEAATEAAAVLRKLLRFMV